MSHFFGTVTIAAGAQARADVGTGGLSGVLIGNESGLTVTVTLQGANTSRSLYPSTVDWFPLPKGVPFTGVIQFDPVANLNNTSSWPSSFVQIDTFGLNEAPTGTYPMALPRNTNVGNTVPTTGGGSTTLQNDNNAANTTVIEATQTGSSGSNMFADNSGNFYLAQYVSSVYTKIFQAISNGASVVKLAATGLLTEVMGSLKVDQNLTVVGTSSLDNGAITTNGAGNTTVGGTLIVSGDATFNGGATGVKVANALEVDANCNVNANLQMGNVSSVFRLLAAIAADNNAHLYCNSDHNNLYMTASNQLTNLLQADGTNSLINILQDFLLTNGKIGVSVVGDVLDASSPTSTYIKARSAGSILFQSPNGSTNFTFDQNGKVTLNQVALSGAGAQYGFLAGNMSRVSAFTGTGSGTFNHNLGATPSIVIPIVSVAGSATQGFDSGSSTQVHVTLGSSLGFTAWCFHS